MTLFQPAVYMRNLIGADLAFFFCLLLYTTFPSATSLRRRRRHDRAISMLGFTLADFVGPGGVGQIDMRIIDKLQSIDRSIAGLQALLKKRGVHGKREWAETGGVAAGAGAGISEFKWAAPWGGRHCNWKWKLGTGNWELAATCATSAATVTFPRWHHLYCR